jgi:hypothetical protein
LQGKVHEKERESGEFPLFAIFQKDFHSFISSEEKGISAGFLCTLISFTDPQGRVAFHFYKGVLIL